MLCQSRYVRKSDFMRDESYGNIYSSFIDEGKYAVASTNNTTVLFIASLLALLVNVAVFGYMVMKAVKTKRNPYTGELYVDLAKYQEVKAMAE